MGLRNESLNMATEHESDTHPARAAVVRGLSLVEDAVYAGLGLLLALFAVALLIGALKSAATSIWARTLTAGVVNLLDQVLLVLLVIELLYTVQISFREHGLVAEPFLVVALIAVIRRILVVTAELPRLPQAGEEVFRHAIIELGMLTAMIIVLVCSFVVLRRGAKPAQQP